MDRPPACTLYASNPDGVVAAFDSTVYRLSAIKKAAYKFQKHFHSVITTQDNGSIEVVLKTKTPISNLEKLVGEFCNEVLDQDLRELVAEQTEGVRNLLLAHAFSQTSLVGTELESADYHQDPL